MIESLREPGLHCKILSVFVLVFFFVVLKIGLMLARQALLPLEPHSQSSFYSLFLTLIFFLILFFKT
jgi:hypothetical protein